MKFAICTLGCKVNTYESEYVSNVFLKHGYKKVDFNEISDIYIINTCTVTNTSDVKSRKMIRQARRRNKDALVVVMGCFSQIRENNDSILDICDVVIGNTNKNKIYDIVLDALKNKKKIFKVDNIMDSSFENMEIDNFNSRVRAFVKIEDGCENYCTYCIIPYVRGKVRSKKKKDVIKEVTSIVNKGHKEIVLTGIHTGHYGSDLEDCDFSDLLSSLEEIDGLERIRISSIEITELNDKFLETLKKSKKIVNHLHIPLQAGSDNILKLMNRKYDLAYYENKIKEIRRIRPSIAITTDVIVGFPNETKEDFLNTISFVKKINFAAGHVFPYSIRKNTVAAKMSNQIDKEEKHIRCKKLINVFDELEDNYYKEYIGDTLSVIPEVYDNNYLIGHTSNYLKVKFIGCKNLIGQSVNVEITGMESKLLIGNLL